MSLEKETEKPSLLIRMGLGGCACGICIKLSIAKNKLVELVKYRGSLEHRRLPPGQKLVKKFPVFDLGIRPFYDAETWSLKIGGEVDNPLTMTLDDLKRMPKKEQVSDFHCATSWSKYDIRWGGVTLKSIAEIVKPKKSAHFLIAHCRDGEYTINLPLETALKQDVLLAYELEGKPLPIEHGGPVRLVVPKLYAWKSAKFLKEISFLENDEPGFWEREGYHNHGDPWKEERYAEK